MWWIVAVIAIVVTALLDFAELYFNRHITKGCEFYTGGGLILAFLIGVGYFLSNVPQ